MKEERETVYLVDGSSYIYRAYHAIRELSTSKGLPTNAIFGFTKMLLRLYQDKTPSYLAIVFDAPGPTFRHKIYERYKATRPPTPEDLTEQIPYIKKIIEGFRARMLEIEGYEADDIIGTVAKIATERGFYVVIVSGDKDFRQLITDRISMWDPMKDRIVDCKSIEEEYRIRPQQFIDVMALCGDRIDNIPGVPSIGEKTALKLIREFETLENIYENISDLKKKSLKERLIEFKENAFLSRELVKINTRVPVEIDCEELKVKEPDKDRLSEIFKELEFISLWNQFAKKKAETDKDYRICNDKRSFRELISEIKKKGIVSIDTESTSEDPMRAELVGISLSMEKDKGIYIPVAHKVKDRQLDRDYVIGGFKEVIEDPNIKKIGQNIKYDALIFKRLNMDIKGIYFDTMVASYVINPGLRQHNLNVLAQQYLNYKMISYKEIVGGGKETFADVDLKSAKEYACEDAEVVWRLWPILDEKLHKEGNASLFYELEMPLIEVLMDMEYSGVKIDEEFFKDMSIRISKELSKLEEEIFEEAGMEFNINSPQQLGFVLFEKLKLPVQKKTTKTKSYSTDVRVLETLSSLNYKLPSLILRYRSLSKLKSTYLDSLLQMINPETGRIHTSFNQTVTATGRLSSSNPNLQNIPIRGEEGREIRKGFIADEGNLLLSADYSQIE
ncbi:MAG TPA: DNA polymerase I, partial [Desulfobacteraceae bacterium]|nr:DNA polymerase I [Desulfobacteraceae bacterium]